MLLKMPLIGHQAHNMITDFNDHMPKYFANELTCTTTTLLTENPSINYNDIMPSRSYEGQSLLRSVPYLTSPHNKTPSYVIYLSTPTLTKYYH
jgi:hypothetical protein